jgi:hypothetical protein
MTQTASFHPGTRGLTDQRYHCPASHVHDLSQYLGQLGVFLQLAGVPLFTGMQRHSVALMLGNSAVLNKRVKDVSRLQETPNSGGVGHDFQRLRRKLRQPSTLSDFC